MTIKVDGKVYTVGSELTVTARPEGTARANGPAKHDYISVHPDGRTRNHDGRTVDEILDLVSVADFRWDYYRVCGRTLREVLPR